MSHSLGHLPFTNFLEFHRKFGGCDVLNISGAQQQQPICYFRIKGIITSITFKGTRNDELTYKACPICMTKLYDWGSSDGYRCEKCMCWIVNGYITRFLFDILVRDGFSKSFVTIFGSMAENLLGLTPREVEEKKLTLADIRNRLMWRTCDFCCKYAPTKPFIRNTNTTVSRNFRFKKTSEHFMKFTLVDAQKLCYKTYNAYLISEIKALTGAA